MYFVSWPSLVQKMQFHMRAMARCVEEIMKLSATSIQKQKGTMEGTNVYLGFFFWEHFQKSPDLWNPPLCPCPWFCAVPGVLFNVCHIGCSYSNNKMRTFVRFIKCTETEVTSETVNSFWQYWIDLGLEMMITLNQENSIFWRSETW